MKSLNLILYGIVLVGCSKSSSDMPIVRRPPDAGRTAMAQPAAAADPSRPSVAQSGPAILHATVKSPDGTTCEATVDDDCRKCIETKSGKSGDASVLSSCDALQGNAKAGPAAGTPRSLLCRETIECVRRTKCHSSNLLECYCGAEIDHGTCFSTKTEAKGACKKEFERSLEVQPGSVGLEALKLITEPDTAGGVAGILATFENTPCAAECIPYQATACK